MNKIKILGKEYDKPTLDFGGICKLEEMGFNFSAMDKTPFNAIKYLLAFTMDTSVEEAVKIVNDNPEECFKIAPQLMSIIEDSDFLAKMIATQK